MVVIMGVSTFTALHVENEGFWIPSSDINGLFFLNNENKLEYKCSFFGGESVSSWEICKVIKDKESLYAFSRRSFEYWKYDVKYNRVERQKYYSGKTGLLSNVEYVNNRVWIIPCDYNCPILNIDLQNREVIEIPYTFDISLGSSGITRTCIYKDKIYWLNRKEKNIYIFSLDCRNNSLKYNAFEDAQFVNCIDVYEDKLCILYYSKDAQSILCLMDINNYEILERINLTDTIKLPENDSLRYFKILYRNNKCFLFPVADENIKIIYENTIEDIHAEEVNRNVQSAGIYNNDIQVEENKVFIYSPGGDSIKVLNLDSEEINEEKIIVQTAYNDALKCQDYGNFIIKENKNINMNDYIKMIK